MTILKPPPPLKPTVQRFYGMERARQVGLPTPDQVKYETSLQAFLSSIPTSAGAGMVSVASPPSMSTPVYLMLGLALVVAATVERALLVVSGNIANSVNGGETDLQFYYGTGTPPITGASATVGTAIGSPMRYLAPSGGALPFSKTVLLTTLTPGTSYWFDLAMRAPTGVGSVSNLDVTAFGLN